MSDRLVERFQQEMGAWLADLESAHKIDRYSLAMGFCLAYGAPTEHAHKLATQIVEGLEENGIPSPS